jgi:hypothetical protein
MDPARVESQDLAAFARSAASRMGRGAEQHEQTPGCLLGVRQAHSNIRIHTKPKKPFDHLANRSLISGKVKFLRDILRQCSNTISRQYLEKLLACNCICQALPKGLFSRLVRSLFIAADVHSGRYCLARPCYLWNESSDEPRAITAALQMAELCSNIHRDCIASAVTKEIEFPLVLVEQYYQLSAIVCADSTWVFGWVSCAAWTLYIHP